MPAIKPLMGSINGRRAWTPAALSNLELWLSAKSAADFTVAEVLAILNS
jgi:hypothetical protein